ncbi:MAG: glycosyltransferase family 4 protein [Armatimonadetes bacterium]|nr:glycosyltransferase family 4 protein [Armatimonadota bacterium]
MAKPRILILTHEYSLTGAPKLILDIARTWQEKAEMRVIGGRPGPLRAEFNAFAKTAEFSEFFHPEPKYAVFKPVTRSGLRQAFFDDFVTSFKPDLIYCNSLSSLEMVAKLPLPAAKRLLHVHEMGLSVELAQKEFPGLISSWPDHVITVSDAARDSLLERAPLDPAIVSRIFASIPAHKPAAKPMNPDEKTFLVGGSGQTNWRKGCELWLMVAAALRERLGDTVRFEWVGIGDAHSDKQFKIMAQTLGLEVSFVQATSKPLDYYKNFDIFLLSSWMDPCPLVVLECMQLGIPCAGFAGSGGAGEEIGDTGIVVQNFDIEEMASRLADLLQNPAERQRFGEMAQARVQAEFNTENQAGKIWQVVESMLDARNVK